MTFAPAETSAAPATRRLAEPIELPDLPEAPSRRPFPILASLVPVVGALVMWQVTGSVFMLWFAALGPFMAVASILDRARSARRERRRAEEELRAACARLRGEVERRHDEERGLRRAAAPDVAALVAHDGWTWRRRGPLVVGTGEAASIVRVTGGEGEEAERLRADAEVLADAPVTVEWQRGICVRGDDVAGRAVVRALVAQLVARHPPTAVRLVGAPLGEGWATGLPHAAADVAAEAAFVAVVRAGDRVPAPATAVIALAAPGEPIPHECHALVEVDEGLRGRLVADGGDVALALEAVSLAQAREIAGGMAAHEQQAADALPDGPIPLAHVLGREAAEHDSDRAPSGLRAVVGAGPHAPDEPAPLVALDLVSDGPHAVVVGTTGSGKSEFLTTWIAALAATRPPSDVVFLLGDFKGGTAFDHLRDLPHVTGVLTDLDGGGARRAVEGLRAEIHRRERAIAGAGARDVGDPRVGLARLVIVIDEFAALLQEHPDLHAVFTDVAARGRALGMHLVLGTQRASGILRDALLANSPLRVALRVAEERESAQLIGSDDAARIPGDASHRGVGYVRRAGDTVAGAARFALTRSVDVERIARAHADVAPARGPLLPPLPDAWRPDEDATGDGAIVLGLRDRPAEQVQDAALLRPAVDRGLLVVGGAGSGKTSLARRIAGAASESGRRVIAVPRDSEGVWDALAAAEADPPELFVVDDADALLGRFPADYAREAAERLEGIVRDAGSTGTMVVLTCARLAGALSKIADVLPRRVVLAVPTIHDHTAAGADRELFDARRPPGRAVLDGYETQLALPPAPADEPRELGDDERWEPRGAVTGLVLRAAARRAASLRAAWGDAVRVVLVDDVAPGTGLEALAGGARLALVGEADAWQRQYALLQRVRSAGDMVVGADCPSELRTLLGERELPPYARPRAARAWLVPAGGAPERVVLP
ncbi:FtsK/SpoIIIE domain-containing protein [Microbacterium karelineae]|uniref:FtsK/SpoIIIE domain-containing protein n=1 Tax=Microbacterium karelineae TaxID=2654283 RepID=UPI0012EAC7E6|nr:FtsK/SpoIIIE domain-containing protein [Microbacterium karelineae]